MKTKAPVLALCLCLLMALTAGCAQTPAASAAGTAKPAGTAEPATAAATTAPSAAPATQSGEKKVIKQLMEYQSTDPNQEPPVKMIEKLTGYDLEFYTLPAEGAAEKLNVEMSTGVEYDLMRISIPEFYTLLGKGALVSFDEPMGQYAPNLKSTFSEEQWATGMYGGKTYGIPQFDAVYVGESIGFNKKIADELGLSVPTTVDELTNFLTTVHTKKPDIVPLTGSGYYISTIASGFGLTGDEWAVADGKVINRIELPEFRQYLAYLADLYAKGILDEEWPINTSENINQKFTTGAAFANLRGWWDAATINPAVEQNTGSTVDYIKLLKAADGKQRYSVNMGSRAFGCIPTTCKDVGKVMDYLNKRADPNNIEPIFLGETGVQHEVRTDASGNKSYWPLFPGFKEWYNGHYFNICMPSEAFRTLWLCRVRKSEILYNVFAVMNDIPQDVLTPNTLSYAPPMAQVSKYTQSASKSAGDFFTEIIVGTKSIDKDYDAFLTQWKADGGQAMIDEINAWYQKK